MTKKKANSPMPASKDDSMKPVSDSDLSNSICVYGAGVLLKHVQALIGEVQGVSVGAEDIEFVHRARVASRRLRASFPLFEDCLPHKHRAKWAKAIKNVTHALGQARDADVQIERLQNFCATQTDRRIIAGLNRLDLRLHQQRDSLQAGLTEAMEKLSKANTLPTMSEHLQPIADLQEEVYLYTPALYQRAFHAIDQNLNAFLAYDEIVCQPEKVAELHAMRIQAKWLRYTLENLGPIYPDALKEYIQAVKKAQESLGEVHDCDVWLQFLPVFMAEEQQRTLNFFGNARSFSRLKPGLLAFQQECQSTRDRYYNNFVRDWSKWREQDLWKNLRKQTSLPFFESKATPEPEENISTNE